VLKWLIPVLLIVVGVFIFVGGLVYGVVTVGVPSHDAPPEVAARENRDMYRADVMLVSGLGIGILGLGSLLIVALVPLAWSRFQAPSK